jgi:hypothetical protein
LRDHAGYSAIGGAKNQRMSASIAGAPKSNPFRIHRGPGFQIRDSATPIGDLPPGINVLSGFAAADAEGPVIVEQHYEAGVGEGLGEPCDGHRDRRATLRVIFRKIEARAEFYNVVDRESDFATGRHRDHLITQSIFGPTTIEAESASRAKKDAPKRRVEPACDEHLFIIELPKHGRWLVVFEDSVSGFIFVEHDSDWSILRRRELIPGHERGRDRVADVIQSRVARTTSGLQQRAVIPNQEDR